MSRTVIVLSFSFFPLWCFGGPFGLDKGMTLPQLGPTAKQVAPGKYRVTSVPKPHSAFDSFIVQVSPKTGLCWVKPMGKTISSSVYGVELKTAFGDMKGRLEQVYGASKTTDVLLPGSIWNEPKDWMMSLRKKERILGSVEWQRRKQAAFRLEGSGGLCCYGENG